MTAEIVADETTAGIRIDDVIVGVRARKDYGDLGDLIDSIRGVGLLQPIGVLPGNRLLFGGRRLEACRRLGWEAIPYVVPQTQDDALTLLKAERDENTCRKEMTASEKVWLAKQIEELERPKARERRTEGARLGGQIRQGSAFGPPVPEAGDQPYRRSSEVAAEAVGMSRKTYERAALVVATADAPDVPDEVRAVAQEAKAGMDAGTLSIKAAQHAVNAALGRSAESVAPPDRPSEPASEPQQRTGRPSARHVIRVTGLRNIVTRLSGYAEAITRDSTLDPALTSEEAARLTDDLSKSIAALQRLNRLVKERTR
ncbi:MAG TPA: ParB/RepB/Spo0J family partition protein [Nocardioidaceae bacterium]|nr:ParB/RepB/Spo0J family partition protein [Nocardioidaceae bacterium]